MSNPIKPTIKTELFPLIVIFLAITASVYFYQHFPEKVPTHWNFRGEIDGWGSPAMAAFAIPTMLVGMYLMFLFIPFLDPKKERYAQFAKPYHFIKAGLISVLGLIYFLASLNGIGYDIPVGFWTPIIIGSLFVVLGNYMGKIKLNWFVGVRTPWTLSSEENWNKTNRFGGKMFVLSGLIFILMPFLPINWQGWLFGVVMAALIFGSFGYSLLLYLKEQKNKK